jgi:hypothetical protein
MSETVCSCRFLEQYKMELLLRRYGEDGAGSAGATCSSSSSSKEWQLELGSNSRRTRNVWGTLKQLACGRSPVDHAAGVTATMHCAAAV